MTNYRVLALIRKQGSSGDYSSIYNTRLSALTRQDAEDVALADIDAVGFETRQLHIINVRTGEE